MGDQQGLIDKPLLETCGVTADEAEKESNDDDDNDDDDPGEEHEFEIIDQVESEEEEGGKESGKDGQGQQKEDGNDMDDYSSSSGDDVDDSEVHAMLEKGIDKETIRKGDRLAPIIKQKIVLKGECTFFCFLNVLLYEIKLNMKKTKNNFYIKILSGISGCPIH